ncbi:MAG: UvrD-helicase domain-containing protein, partial [Myxococcota bacterium]
MRLRRVGRDLEIDWDDPSLRLTASQRLAMATDRELVVTAGAGTGKTHTLALRYVALQLKLANAGDDDVERVVVLTFTEKAAHEMTERCRARLAAVAEAARAHQGALDADEPGRGAAIVAALDARVDGFDRAQIGTFHGFCARIVREYPAETETPPGMTLLDPVEAARRVTETLASTLLAHVARHPDELPPLLDAFGTHRALLEAGRAALDRLSVLESALAAHAEGRVTVEDALQAARPSPAEAERWVATVGWPSLQLLARLVAPSGGGAFVEGTLGPALRDGSHPREGGADPLAVYARYRAVLDLLTTEEGTLRRLDHSSVLGKKERWPDGRRYEQAKEAARALTARLGDWQERARAARTLPTPADRARRPFARWLLTADRALAAATDRDRVLTFEQLQRRVVRAVTGRPELAAALRERFRYLMVDEFQDTDEAQWAMVRALARARPEVPEDRVFVVGDPKQAIYGFRGGDVTVFRAATLALGVEPIALLDNFRSRPGLIRWFNDVWPSVLSADTPYEPLAAGRTDGGGEVTLIRTEDGAEATARWVAARLAVPDPALAALPTPPVAILLRARTRQAEFELALRRYGVPYVVVGGVGLWSRPEVMDLVNAVAAVALADPVSVVGVLRGPLIGLPDPEVVADADHPALAPWQALRHAVSPAVFVRRVADALAASLAAADPSPRAAANLALVAEQVDRWPGLTLAAVAERLLDQVDDDARAAEASLVPAEARVVLCTVHAAKGLEFPVVVVPELHTRPRGEVGPLLVARPTPGAAFDLASRVLDPDA